MITATFFNELNKRQQANVLERDAYYLNTRQEPQFIIDMYLLEDFYVEVYYHKTEANLVVVKSFYEDNRQNEALAENNIRYLSYYSYCSRPGA